MYMYTHMRGGCVSLPVINYALCQRTHFQQFVIDSIFSTLSVLLSFSLCYSLSPSLGMFYRLCFIKVNFYSSIQLKKER